VKEGGVKIVTGDPTPLQLSAWHRLWTLLLAPTKTKDPVTVDETATGSEGVHGASGPTERVPHLAHPTIRTEIVKHDHYTANHLPE
jgi:hypothetical protein